MERKRTLRERTSKFIKDLVSDWRPSRDQVLWTIRVVIMLTVLLTILTLIGAPFGITLWAWVELLIVPVVLAIGGYLFSRSENRATQAAAERRAQDEALQAYLDKMSDMLIPTEGQPSLIKARSGEGMREVARARTLTVLPRLDSTRKARVVQFLYEADLIAKGRPFLDLSGANLTYADLSGANLSGADLRGANLSGAGLGSADLREANLSEAKLIKAHMGMAVVDLGDLGGFVLGGAYLGNAKLKDANLSGADLSGAYLVGTDLGDADLSKANLSEAKLFRANLKGADLSGAYLSGADLERAKLNNATLSGADLTSRYGKANLSKADLSKADLSGADLSGADLTDADLSYANLALAEGITQKQLKQAEPRGWEEYRLEGATMPDGQTLKSLGNPDGPTFEEWLKSKGSGENE